MDIKILIAMHKPYWTPEDDVYLPLQVGSALHPHFLPVTDDSGDNISAKNPGYCEMTGLYWAWKNLKADYVGLCHYRRYFGHRTFSRSTEERRRHVFLRGDYEHHLSRYAIILPKKRNYYIETVRSQYEHAHHKKELDAVESVIRETCPGYLDAFRLVMNGRELCLLNMFATTGGIFSDYCGWIFDMLARLEERIDTSAYTTAYERRVFGFLAERLFNVWLTRHPLRCVYCDVVMLERVNWLKKGASFLKRRFLGGRSGS